MADGVGLNVTAMTYQGSVFFGLLGCRRLVPDVGDLAVWLDDALGELAAAALDAAALGLTRPRRGPPVGAVLHRPGRG